MNTVQNESLSYSAKEQKGKGWNSVQDSIAFPDISPSSMKMNTSNILESDILALSNNNNKIHFFSNVRFPLGLLCTLQPPLILLLLLLSNTRLLHYK